MNNPPRLAIKTMDSIRVGHIRQFANAVSLALQGHPSRLSNGQQHLKLLLDAVVTSNRAGQFIASPQQAQQQSSWKPGKQVTVLPAPQTAAATVQTPAPAPGVLLPMPMPAHTPTPTKKPKPVQAAASMHVAAVQSVKATAAVTPSNALATRFFTMLPWAGQAPARQADIPMPLPQALASQQPKILALNFFADLPWASVALGQSMSIGTGTDDPEKAQRLSAATGRLPLPAYITSGSSASAKDLANTAAFGFFSKLPWSGRQTLH